MSTLKEKRLADLRTKEEELIALAEGSKSSEVSESETIPTQSVDDKTEEPSEVESDAITEQEDKQQGDVPVQDLDYWKKRALDSEYRFGKYKASTDTTIYKLRSEVSELRTTKLSLVERTAKLEEQIESFSGVEDDPFTQDVVDVLGTEAVDAIKKVIERTKGQVVETNKKLQKQTLESEQTATRTAEAAKFEAFVTALEAYVPDCRIMNNDTKFIEWLEQPGETGTPRISVMQAAQKIGDVVRVAQFFNDYKKTLVPVKPTPQKDTIASRVGPTQRATTSETQSKVSDDKVSLSFIRQHEADVSKGRYKGKRSEQLAIDKRIEKAYLTGNIIDD